ncbi:MAG: hypothetical protein ACOX8W_04180 [bacterium]
MKLLAEKYLALRCSLCGKLDYHVLSLFSFSGKKTHHIHCQCGFRKAIVGTKDHKNFWLQIPCVVCETDHLFRFTGEELWTSELEDMLCPGSGQELGFLGSESQVRAAAEFWDDETTAGFDDYFVNPGIMFEILNHLHDIAEKKGLYCQCGNRKIEVELYPERLELRCPQCNSCSIIYAETDDDLRVVQKFENIEMVEHGFAYLDASNFRPLRRRKH